MKQSLEPDEGSRTAPRSEPTWRDEVLQAALSYGANKVDMVLLGAILRLRPDLHTAFVHGNRERIVKFLEAQDGYASLLPTTHFSVDEVRLGWCRVKWQEHTIEIVLGVQGNNTCLSAHPDALRDFAHALDKCDLHPKGRCLEFSHNTWYSSDELDAEVGRVTWSDIVLPDMTLRGIREAVEGFFAHREVIQSFGFRWKRGVLLVGPPGTGKTMVCKAVAASLPDLPFLYVRDLVGHGDPLAHIFHRARKLSPCVLAFEDLDGLVKEHNRTQFLNEMDGFESNEGLLIIASSNHPGKIDEALLRRPSRFDRVFHLGLPQLEERRAFCERVLSRSELRDKLAPDFDALALSRAVAGKTDGFTPAYLKEALLSAALHRALEGAHILDDAFAETVLMQVEELRVHLKKSCNPDTMAEMRSDDGIGFLN